MENYFLQNETTDFAKLQELNNKQNWFKSLTQLDIRSTIDCSGLTHTDVPTYIEYKTRHMTLERAKEFKYIFIEADKLKAFSDITRKYKGNVKRLFVNFLNDAILIFNMNKPMDIKYLPNQRINNVGYNDIQWMDRLGLDINDALIIDNTNPN